MDACVKHMPRVLVANIAGGYSAPRRKAATETAAQFAYRATEDVNKERHLKKDGIKTYVEKALALHDERQGMPVVSSPIWAPKSSGRSA